MQETTTRHGRVIQIRTTLWLNILEVEVILPSLEFQLFMLDSFPYVLCTQNIEVFQSYREQNPVRSHLLK